MEHSTPQIYTEFLPISRADMEARGWEQLDFVVVGGEMSPIAAAAFGFYCWAYLVLLRQWRGERARWLGVYWFGALLPLVIVLVSFSVMQRSL